MEFSDDHPLARAARAIVEGECGVHEVVQRLVSEVGGVEAVSRLLREDRERFVPACRVLAAFFVSLGDRPTPPELRPVVSAALESPCSLSSVVCSEATLDLFRAYASLRGLRPSAATAIAGLCAALPKEAVPVVESVVPEDARQYSELVSALLSRLIVVESSALLGLAASIVRKCGTLPAETAPCRRSIVACLVGPRAQDDQSLVASALELACAILDHPDGDRWSCEGDRGTFVLVVTSQANTEVRVLLRPQNRHELSDGVSIPARRFAASLGILESCMRHLASDEDDERHSDDESWWWREMKPDSLLKVRQRIVEALSDCCEYLEDLATDIQPGNVESAVHRLIGCWVSLSDDEDECESEGVTRRCRQIALQLIPHELK